MAFAARASPRFFVPARLSPGAEVDLPGRAARHVSVLRLAGGDPVTLFNGDGGEYAAQLVRASRDSARALVGARRAAERESPLSITLAQCISAGERMDLAVQKATELGAARIVPIASERTVVRLAGERAERRVAHWRAIAEAACEQCGRNRVPEVADIAALDAYLAGSDAAALRLVLAPEAQCRLKDCEPAAEIAVLAGPEGGLSPGERARAEARGFVPVRFGPRVLRTETAPLAVIAALQSLWGDC